MSSMTLRSLIVFVLVLACATGGVLAWQASGAADAPDAKDEIEESSLTLLFTNRGAPVTRADFAKFYIYQPGRRNNYVAWGHAARTARFEPGTYDVVIRYENDAILEERVWTDVEIIGDYVEPVAFDIRTARLTVDINSGGRPIESFTGNFAIYPPGQSGKPIARERPGTTVTVRRGTYDIVATYRDPEGLKTKRLEGYDVEHERFETVELGVALARLTVTLTRDGRPVDADAGTWRVFHPGQRRGYVAQRASGETLTLEPGTYDIGAFYRDGESRSERWAVRVGVDGDMTRSIDIGTPKAELTVRVSRRGREEPDAWCTLFAPNDRAAALATGSSGVSISVDPGTYDIGCFLREGGPRIEHWLEGVEVNDGTTLEAELDRRPAFLQLHPRSTGRSGSGKSRLLVIVDSSAGMRIRAGDRRRIDVVKSALHDVIDGMPSNRIDVGLRVFGAAVDGRRSCSDSQLVAEPNGFNRASLSTGINRLEPNGHAPIGYALEQAAGDFPRGRGNSIVIVTSGLENCDGDPCRTAARLIRDGVVDRISVIGFDVDRDLSRGLDCIGHYYNARTSGELKSALRETVRNGTRWAQSGTLSVFNAGRTDEWVTGGFVGEKIRLPEGLYDILMYSRGKIFEWEGVRVVGNFEALVGRNAPRGATGRERD